MTRGIHPDRSIMQFISRLPGCGPRRPGARPCRQDGQLTVPRRTPAEGTPSALAFHRSISEGADELLPLVAETDNFKAFPDAEKTGK